MPELGRAFPPLPDAEFGERIIPAIDGRAWRKACPECACRTSDPQELGNAYQEQIMTGRPGTLFYCIHRAASGEATFGKDGLPNEPVRVCACYAALHPEQANRQ